MKITIWDKEIKKFVELKNIESVYDGKSYIGIRCKNGNYQELKTTSYDLTWISDE